MVGRPLSVDGCDAGESVRPGVADQAAPAIVDRVQCVSSSEITDSYDDCQFLRNEAISSDIGRSVEPDLEPVEAGEPGVAGPGAPAELDRVQEDGRGDDDTGRGNCGEREVESRARDRNRLASTGRANRRRRRRSRRSRSDFLSIQTDQALLLNQAPIIV